MLEWKRSVVGGLPGFLVAVVASALEGSLYLRWGWECGRKEGKGTKDSV